MTSEARVLPAGAGNGAGRALRFGRGRSLYHDERTGVRAYGKRPGRASLHPVVPALILGPGSSHSIMAFPGFLAEAVYHRCLLAIRSRDAARCRVPRDPGRSAWPCFADLFE